MELFAWAMALAFILAFVAFGMWLLPPIEVEVQRTSWNVQRLLLLAGFVWISIGTGFYLVFSEMLRNPTEATRDVPHGIQYVGYGLIGVGVSHLIAYVAGLMRKES